MIKKIALLCSGGDAPGMNAAIRAVVRTSAYYEIRVAGIMRGYDGLIDGDFMEMDPSMVSNIIQSGGTILKTSRSRRFITDSGMEQAYKQLTANNIDGVIVIGGNGSFAGAEKFTSKYNIPWIGIPKTIDNDLDGTDYCIGYDTAINTAMQAVDKIKDTADSHNRLFFVEVMGRDAGFIALRTGIASGAEAVLLPESDMGTSQLIELLERGWKRKKSSMIVIVAEGNRSGGAFEIAELVKQKSPHYEIGVCILGHLQRGGSPTCMDRVLASELGVYAVEALLKGEKNKMVGEINKKIVLTTFSEAISQQKYFDMQMLDILNKLSV